MKYRTGLLLLPLLAGCAPEKDPYEISENEAQAAAARVRPPIPKGGLPAPGAGGPVRIKWGGPVGKEGSGNPAPGAVPLGNGDNLLSPTGKN